MSQLQILQVGSGLKEWGGIERYVAYLQSGLEANGHSVEVTAPPKSKLLHHCKKTIAVQAKGKHDPRAFSTYLRLFKLKKYDVVHIHFNPDFLVAGISARMRKQRKVVLTRHVALPWSKNKVRLYNPIFDHIIPVSDAVKHQLLRSGIERQKMTVAKAGTPIPSQIVDEEFGEGFHVGSFGRLAPEKGIDLFIEAARNLPEVKFHVYGRGPSEAELKKTATKNVIFHGFREDVTSQMASMDVIVLASRWEEAFPYTALEAMAVAKPLVVSRVGGMLEIVEDGVTGLSFARDNAEDLASQISVLNRSQSRARLMGERGQSRHLAEFTVQHMADRIETVYERLMDQV